MSKIKFILMWIVSTILIILLLIAISYKSKKNGNNTNEDVEKTILNINSYRADITVKVISNKNDNEYHLKQEVTENYEKQVGISPDEICNMEIIFENNVLQLKKSKISANKAYKDYKMTFNNDLFLTDFIKNYKNSNQKKHYEKDNTCFFEYESSDRYRSKFTLSVDKETKKPTKMEINDNNNKTEVYILYNEIEINI